MQAVILLPLWTNVLPPYASFYGISAAIAIHTGLSTARNEKTLVSAAFLLLRITQLVGSLPCFFD